MYAIESIEKVLLLLGFLHYFQWNIFTFPEKRVYTLYKSKLYVYTCLLRK